MSSPRAVRSQRAALLAIGDEVLRGEVSNTNAAFLAERLFESGYELAEQVVVSDDPQSIRTALVRLRAEMDVVIATGGLGPTEDDRTVDVVAELLVTGTSPGRAVARCDEEALLDARLRADAQQPASGPHPERHPGAPQHGRDRARVRGVAGYGGGVFPARRPARDGEDVHRRGDAAPDATAGRDRRAASR